VIGRLPCSGPHVALPLFGGAPRAAAPEPAPQPLIGLPRLTQLLVLFAQADLGAFGGVGPLLNLLGG